MFRTLWVALLLGYVVGVAASLVVLPGPIVEPLYGGIAVGSVVVIAAIAAAIRYAPGGRRAALVDGPALAGDLADEHPHTAWPAVETARDAVEDGDVGDSAVSDADGVPAGDEVIDVRPDPLDQLVSVEALLHLLERDRLQIILTPVACLPEGRGDVFQASPRLGTDDGLHLEPAHYLPVAGRAGLVRRIDQLAIARCIELLVAALDEGREARILCPVAATSLNDPDCIATVEHLLEAQPEVGGRLVLLVGQLRLHRPAGAEIARLTERGLPLALRRLSVRGLNAAELAARGITFVRLDAPHFALRAGQDRLPREVRTALDAFEQHGIGLVLDRAIDAPSGAPGGADVAARRRRVEEAQSSAA